MFRVMVPVREFGLFLHYIRAGETKKSFQKAKQHCDRLFKLDKIKDCHVIDDNNRIVYHPGAGINEAFSTRDSVAAEARKLKDNSGNQGGSQRLRAA